MHWHTTLFITLSTYASACTSQSTVPNPTGDCATDSDGSRTCYHAPMATDTHLPDCNNALNREYWRVFAQSEDSAYIIPRPDGMGLVYDLCDSSELGVLLDEYGLCTESLSAGEVSLINDIPIDSALTIANALHEHLRFTVEDDRLYPWAPPDDLMDACTMSDEHDATVEEYCQTVLEYYDNDGDCPSIAFEPSPETATVLARRLNALYGISTAEN